MKKMTNIQLAEEARKAFYGSEPNKIHEIIDWKADKALRPAWLAVVKRIKHLLKEAK
jgi:hypothetical protein